MTIQPTRYSLLTFFLLTFAISWGFWFLFPTTLGGLVGAWGPSLAAIVITLLFDGGQALRALLRRLFVWRVPFYWYLFVLCWPAALSLLVTGLGALLGRPLPDFANPPVVSQYPLPLEVMQAGFLVLLPTVFVIQTLGSSLGEELGWRGFAIPRLQAGQSALVASLILGLLWGIWHLPRVWTPGGPLDAAGFAWLVVGIVLDAVLYTWVMNNSRGSLLLMVLFHNAQALTNLFLAQTPNPALETVLTAILVGLVVVRGRIDRRPV